MNFLQSKLDDMIEEMWSIFYTHGGYDYNDEMIYQLEGITEYEEQKDSVESVFEDVLSVYNWFKWVESIRQLQENEPPKLFD